MHLDSFLLVGISQCLGNIATHEHDLVINLASTNLAENITCKTSRIHKIFGLMLVFSLFLPAKIPFFSPKFHPFPPKNTHNLTVGERVLGDDEERRLHTDETVNIVRMDDKILKDNG